MTSPRQTSNVEGDSVTSNDPQTAVLPTNADTSAEDSRPVGDTEPASVVYRCLDNNDVWGTLGTTNSMVGATLVSASSPVFDSEVAFERRISSWVRETGLFTDDAECPGATSYIRTAYQLFPENEIREAVAKYMLLVAMGDVLLDKRLETEDSVAHQMRIAQSVAYLREALELGVERVGIPNVPGAETLAVITRQWQAMLWQYTDRAARVAVRQWVRALDEHYAASVREWLPEVVDSPLLRDLQGRGETKKSAMNRVRTHYGQKTQPMIALRIEELLQSCGQQITASHPALLELRLWMYLMDVNTIGAGLAFRTAALALTEARVPEGAFAVFQRTLSLLDMRIRLANDASGFFENAGRDRDEGKVNSCTLLISQERERNGAVRASVMNRAIQIYRGVCQRIDTELDSELAELAAQWPEMGQWVTRGRKIGVRAYEVGHYTTLDREAFTSLLEAS